MKVSGFLSGAVTALCFACGALLPTSAAAQTAQAAWQSGKWQFTATIYGWFPTINGKVNFPGDLGSTDIHVPFHDILDHLKMGGMGALEAHNGHWGVFTDALYLDVGGVKSQRRDFSIGSIVLRESRSPMMHDCRSWTSVPTSFSGDDILNDCERLGRKAWISASTIGR